MAEGAVGSVLRDARLVAGKDLRLEWRTRVTVSQLLPFALLVLVLCWAWDMLFFHFNTLPATVPVAVAIVILELWYRRAPSARPLASER